jgi:hypothetical protein
MIGFAAVFGTLLILSACCSVFLWLMDWSDDDRYTF